MDYPGLASPKPGLPLFKGPDALAGYLGSLGIRYVAVLDPRRTTTLYDQRTWQQHAAEGGEMMANFAASGVLDLFASLEQLRDSRQRVFDEGGMVVMDLRSPR
jgi:hypothetical protein